MTCNKKVILWTTNIDDFVLKNPTLKIGGILVQMFMWSQAFADNNWAVFSLSNNRKCFNKKIGSIFFLPSLKLKYITPIISIFNCIYIFLYVQPQLIIVRGATRDLFMLQLISKLLKVKLLLMIASDSDLRKNEELISRPHDKILYRLGLRFTSNFIVQNISQKKIVRKLNYNSNTILIPNIWLHDPIPVKGDKVKKQILWVSNFRKLKRPEWFIKLAQKYPTRQFVMIGGAIDQVHFDYCKKISERTPNLKFLGSLNFPEVNTYFSMCRLFICTSEIEGFPNTFLQAWSNKCPVISTFDPSNLIRNQELGAFCNSFEEVCMAIEAFENRGLYTRVQINIERYFMRNHDAHSQFKLVAKNFSLS